jgi:hypothetical protein
VRKQDQQRTGDDERRSDGAVHDGWADVARQHVIDDLDALPQVRPHHHRDVAHAEQEGEDTGRQRHPAPTGPTLVRDPGGCLAVLGGPPDRVLVLGLVVLGFLVLGAGVFFVTGGKPL